MRNIKFHRKGLEKLEICRIGHLLAACHLICNLFFLCDDSKRVRTTKIHYSKLSQASKFNIRIIMVTWKKIKIQVRKSYP